MRKWKSDKWRVGLAVCLMVCMIDRAATLSQCVSDFFVKFSGLPGGNVSSAGQAALEKYLSDTYTPCVCTSTIVLTKSIRVLAPAAQLVPNLQSTAANWQNVSGVTVNFNPVNPLTVAEEALNDVQQNVSLLAYSAWIQYSGSIATMAAVGGNVDLTERVLKDDSLKWQNILSFYRKSSLVYDGKIAAVPLDGEQLLMYYRKDMFALYNLEVPVTWQEVLNLATHMNGTDFNGDGDGDFGVCIGRVPNCKSFYWPFMLSAAYLQYKGTRQGGYFDPNTMESLTNNSGFEAGMSILKALVDLSPPPEATCQPSTEAFDTGCCLMTFNFGDQFKVAELSRKSWIRGKVGVAPLPGSDKVWVREQRKLVDCTETLCPYAERYQRQNKTIWVNKTPYVASGGWAIGVSSVAQKEAQDTAFLFAAYLASPEVSTAMVLDPNSGIDPYRTEHLNPTTWAAAGYDLQDTILYLAAVKKSLESDNVLLPLTIPSTQQYITTLDTTVPQYLSGSKPIDQTMNELTAAVTRVIMAKGLTESQNIYRKAIGWIAPAPPPPSAAVTGPELVQVVKSPKGHRNFATWKLVLIIVLPSTFVILLVVALVFALRWNARYVRVRTPPSAGPNTTLVVTDIQDFASLQEQIPSEIMQEALKVYHQILRTLLPPHAGYESISEGDSLVLAFHTSQEALSYCMAAQEALLHAPWPPALLSQPGCKLLHAFQRPGAAKLAEAASPKPCKVKGAEKSFKHMKAPEAAPTDDYFEEDDIAQTFLAHERARTITAEGELTRADGEFILIFQGLRACMGLHAGVEAGCIDTNDGTRKRQYRGQALDVAKKVSNAGHGGMIVMSGSVYSNIDMEALSSKIYLLHAGEHNLGVYGDPYSLYTVFPKSVSMRLGVSNPLCTSLVTNGALEAPAGLVSIVFVYIVGVHSLLQSDGNVAKNSINMLQRLAQGLLQKYNGYCVEAVDNLVLAAFQCAHEAILWSTELHSQALMLDWPDELLTHELAEVMTLGVATENGVQEEVILRGLRLKFGIDNGVLACAPHSTTGRMAYQGKTMNRASRIASRASSGEVLCSKSLWHAAALNLRGEVDGIPKGAQELKGVQNTVEIYQCRVVASQAKRLTSGVVLPAELVVSWDTPAGGTQSNYSGLIKAISGIPALLSRMGSRDNSSKTPSASTLHEKASESNVEVQLALMPSLDPYTMETARK